MPLDPAAVGARTALATRSWDSADCLLYALGIGAGQDPAAELEYTTENSAGVAQRAYPTMAVVLAPSSFGLLHQAGEFNPAMLVHGEETVILHQPIPVEGSLSAHTEIVGIYDKGSGGVIVTETRANLAATGEPLFTLQASAFIRGAGGFGGDRGPSGGAAIPDRAPDHSISLVTRPEQALVYRLSGDRNPLHSDPGYAAGAGFSQPILHGLCTFGFSGRALLRTVGAVTGGDLAAIGGRFTSPVLPGEEITVRAWQEADQVVYTTHAGDARLVLSGWAKFA
jgi:acyl dehydratase